MATDYIRASGPYIGAHFCEDISVIAQEDKTVATSCPSDDKSCTQELDEHGAFVELFQLGDLSSFLEKCDHLLAPTADSRRCVGENFCVQSMVISCFGIYQA